MLERIRFMKVNRNKQFDYTPRYYDERKERLNKLVDRYKKEDKNLDTSSAEYRAKIKQRIEQNWELNSATSSQSRAANVRLILILGALLLAAYYVLDYVSLFSAEVITLENLD
jgi:hypothetical protein